MDDRDVVLGRCELKALQADATVSVSLPTLPFTLDDSSRHTLVHK
jgi:hypothetical protein